MKISLFILTIALLAGSTQGNELPKPPLVNGDNRLPVGNVKPMISMGTFYGVVLASDGSLWSWGEERCEWPILGLDDTNIHKSVSLRRIGHETNWGYISAGDYHCLAVKSDGSIWSWGGNKHYQLGDGTTTNRVIPVKSHFGSDWKQAVAGNQESYGLKNDGTLWAWGQNTCGEFGTNRFSIMPVQVGNSHTWAKVLSGNNQTLGLQTDGSLWFWGSINGDNKEIRKRPLPVTTIRFSVMAFCETG